MYHLQSGADSQFTDDSLRILAQLRLQDRVGVYVIGYLSLGQQPIEGLMQVCYFRLKKFEMRIEEISNGKRRHKGSYSDCRAWNTP